jgi:hypothetical protein
MTGVTQGPWNPEAETLDEHLQRVIRNAGEPSPEQYARLAALLGFSTRGGDRDG